jgi:GLPGLI family protein
MKKILFVLLAACSLSAQSQTFVTEAKIEYEKTVNTRKLMAKSNMPDAFKEGMPEFTKNYYDLILKNDQSVYQKGRDPELKAAPQFSWGSTDDRVIYNNYENGTTTVKKTIAWDDYYIQDTGSKINWRITMDTRTIAGFECRRATAVLFDSVFVVAFYTDEITGSGGPESFGGLPGTILGLVIPRIHTTWYATTVRRTVLPDEKIEAPKPGRKSKIYTYSQVAEKVKEKTKSWTWEAANNHKYIWSTMW